MSRSERRERNREHSRRYRERHPDRVKQSQKKYEAANPRQNNPERNRVYQLKRFHGMTPLEYEQLWESQNGRCYLCGDALTRGKGTHIEHDHECCPAGESCFRCRRGLACSHCNLVIAHAFESPERLRCIADALERVATAGRCRLCGVRVGPGERTCAEHTSAILTEAEMAALYAEAMQGEDA